jgi:hypothetical protein
MCHICIGTALLQDGARAKGAFKARVRLSTTQGTAETGAAATAFALINSFVETLMIYDRHGCKCISHSCSSKA